MYGLRALVRCGTGTAGRCGVRRNLDGALRLVVYGKAVTAHVFPIEKKPFHHLVPGSEVFSIGTYGYNLSCAWCQNRGISQDKQFDPEHSDLGRPLPSEKIVKACLRN